MALELQRSDIKELFALILASFKGPDSHEEFYEFINDTLQLDIFQEFYDARTGLAKHALAVIKRTEKNGTTDKLVRGLLLRRKGDPELREFVRRLLPAALALVSEQEFEAARVQSALVGVGIIERLCQDPQVSQKIARIRFDLEQTASDLRELTAYKGMHDALHDLQLKLYYPISDEVRRFPAGKNSVETLERYAEQLTIVHAEASDAADALPTAVLISAEKNWIGDFKEASDGLSNAVSNKDRGQAKSAEYQLRQVLRREPPRLNGLLVQTARRIPWDKLIDTMTVVAEGLHENVRERQPMLEAAKALRSLMMDVLARIEEHELWQKLESNFWKTEEVLQRNDRIAAAEIGVLWPILSEQIHKICQRSPEDWARKLERHEVEFKKVCPIPPENRINVRARSAFRQLMNSGRVRFFLVDRDLKAQCNEISKLSDPLKRLVP